ncbi:M20 metallopeptidase family protein [Peptoniphilus stercorisuis]|uniref:Amidohydrolase n=1 Tax=Peptoniphilus stercorisuis TaxID=1436965 RepID=A0ABS4KDR7_9FIRM|nr:M20 family metallopeptidase [Peptoniphilus stercorisuis]MBP2025914.1 amidohydrolase [Peptoniphilus stercorisuis]
MYDYLKRAKEIEKDIIKDRRHIHQNPEVGDELPETYNYVTSRLKEMGYKPEKCAKYGVVATVGNSGKTFMIRADMDALPMEEDSGLPFASVYKDKAHTCGHDTHIAMLLGAAKLLKENERNLKGTVKLMFQPNEEGLNGAIDMIDDGVLNGVDRALALHIDATMPLGYLTVGRGHSFASNDFFDIEIIGKGGHAARPADAIDPINIMSHIQLAIQSLISREATPTETNVISITSVKAGEGAYNIIPDKAIMKGTLRTYNEEQRALLKVRLKEISEQIASVFKANAKITYHGDGIPALHCNEILSEELENYANELLGEGYVAEKPFKKVGSEDFAYICQRIPSGYFFLGAGPDEKSVWPYGQHNPKVVHNESAFCMGAAVYAQCASRWLEENR